RVAKRRAAARGPTGLGASDRSPQSLGLAEPTESLLWVARNPSLRHPMQHKLGFIGGGNMAEALVRGLLASGAAQPDQLRIGEPSAERRQRLADQLGVVVTADNREVADWCDVVVLAVKPQVLPAVLE